MDPHPAYGAQLDLREKMSNGDYLDLDALLGARPLRSENHDDSHPAPTDA